MSTLKSFPLLTKSKLKMLNLTPKIDICLRVNQALQILRILTAVRSAVPISISDRLALSDAIYFLDWQLLPTYMPCTEILKADFIVNMNKAFRISALLYIDIVLREMHSINIAGLVHRLIETLRDTLGDCFQELIRNSRNVLVLWILFIGGVASKSSVGRRIFMQALGYICRERNFRSHIDFVEEVDRIGPGLQFFGGQSAEIWTEISLLEVKPGEPQYVPV